MILKQLKKNSNKYKNDENKELLKRNHKRVTSPKLQNSFPKIDLQLHKEKNSNNVDDISDTSESGFNYSEETNK